MSTFHKLELAINQSLNVVTIKTATDEYHPRLPQQGQIVVSPWPRPQHQYVKNGFFKNHKTTGFMPPKTVLLRTTNLP